MKDEEIVKQIRNGNHDAPIKQLYREYPKIEALIRASGGDSNAAREIFHDALILFIEKVIDPAFEQSSKLTTYLYGINRLLWKNKLRKRQNNPELEWPDTLILTNEDLGYDHEKEDRIKTMERVLAEIAERCREILKRFYLKKESMSRIASELGFSSVNSAKTQKYKCLEQAIRLATNYHPKNA
ncbi:MAG: hypothetical protein GC178_17625 [Flavobacteriales bacterium]|nr:hypothetical protein [Flavobacteriales bacterium]